MVQKNILVSILINNYNNQKFIKKSILSCLNQSYKNIEIIIYDDKSNDNSQNIINKFKDVRIKKIFNKTKKNNSSALNQLDAIYKSFKCSKGEIVFLLDGDDFFKPDKIKLITNIFNKYKNVDFIQDNPTYFFPEENKFIKKNIKRKIFTLHTWPYFNPTSTMVFKRKFFDILLKEISFSKSNYKNVFFDARAFIYIHFFKKNYLQIRESFTIYTQNISGDTISKYNKMNFSWWKRRKEYHHYVDELFKRKNKYRINLFDYYITLLINIFFKFIIKN